jgi:hypothetical protein
VQQPGELRPEQKRPPQHHLRAASFHIFFTGRRPMVTQSRRGAPAPGHAMRPTESWDREICLPVTSVFANRNLNASFPKAGFHETRGFAARPSSACASRMMPITIRPACI